MNMLRPSPSATPEQAASKRRHFSARSMVAKFMYRPTRYLNAIIKKLSMDKDRNEPFHILAMRTMLKVTTGILNTSAGQSIDGFIRILPT